MDNSKLDRDSVYRVTALECAVKRAGQDGGLSGDAVDVFGLAESYYAWLKGGADTAKPMREKIVKVNVSDQTQRPTRG